MTPTPLLPTGYGDSRTFDPWFRDPLPDFGSIQSFSDEAANAWQTGTMGGAMSATGKYALADALSRLRGLGTIGKAEFDSKYAAAKGRFDWEPGMSHARAELMYEDIGDVVSREARTAGSPDSHMIARLGGGFVGSLHPVDMWTLGKVGKAMEPFYGLSAAEKLAGKVGIVRNLGRGAVSGMGENTLQQIPVAATADYRQQAYTPDMLLSNMAVGAIMGGTFGAVRAMWSNTNPNARQAMARAAMDAAVAGGDDTDVHKAAQTDPNVARAAQAARDASELAQRAERTTDEEIDGVAANMAADTTDPITIRQVALEEQIRVRRERLAELAKARKVRTDDPEGAAAAASNARVAGSEKMGEVIPEPTGKGLPTDEVKLRAEIDRLVNQAEKLRQEAEARASSDPRKNPVQKLTHKVAMERSRAGTAGEEGRVAGVFRKVFGVEIRFYDPSERSFFGGHGRTGALNPGVLFVEAGSTGKLLYVAGHELAHSIRFRSPKVWTEVVRAIMESGDAAVMKAYRQGLETQGRAWRTMGRSTQFDESMANVLADAMRSPDFWRALYKNKSAFEAVVSYLKQVADWLRVQLTGKSYPALAELHAELARIISQVDPDNLVSHSTWKSRMKADKALDYIYRPYATKFAAAIRKTGPAAKAAADRLEQIDTLINDFVAQEWSMTDNAGKKTRVLTRRLQNYDPAGFAFEFLFPKFYPRIYEALKKGYVEVEVKGDSQMIFTKAKRHGWTVVSPDRVRITREDILAGRHADPQVAEALGPLPFFHFVKNEDGTHTFWLTDADSYVRLTEEIADTFDRHGERARDTLSDKEKAVRAQEARDSQVSDKVDGSPDDPKGKNLFDDSEEGRWDGYEDTRWTPAEIARMDAAVNRHVRAEGVGPWTLGNPETPTLKIGEALVAGTDEAIDELRAEIRRDILAELDQMERTAKELIEMGLTGDKRLGMGKTLIHELRTATVDEVIAYLKQQKDDKIANIDSLVDDRMENIIPNYARRDDINKLALDRIKDAEWEVMHPLDVDHIRAMTEDGTMGEDTSILLDDVTDEDVYSNMAAADPSAPPVRQVRKITVEEAARQGEANLKREAAEGIAWIKNAQAAVVEAVTNALEKSRLKPILDDIEKLNNLRKELEMGTDKDARTKLKEDMKVLDEKIQAARRGLSERDGNLFDLILATRTNAQNRTAALNTYIRTGAFDKTDVAVKKLDTATLAELEDLYLYHLRNSDGNPDIAGAAALDDIAMRSQLQIYRAIRSERVFERLSAILGNGVKTLYSYLDGLARKGVKGAGGSVHGHKRTQLVRDTAPLLNMIEAQGRHDDWKSNTLVKALIMEMQGRKSGDKGLAAMASLLRTTLDAQVARLNSLGANIRHLDGFVFSQIHDAHRITKAGFDRWAADVNRWADWAQIEKTVGIGPEGHMIYLREVFNDITTGRMRDMTGMDPDNIGGNLANRNSRRRSLHFLEGQSFDYDMAYGSGDTGALILSQLNARAERSVFMAHFGPDPRATFNEVLGGFGLGRHLKGFAALEYRRMVGTFEHLTGGLDNPVDRGIASVGQAIRSYVNLVSLWSTTISSITDISGAAAMMRYMGMDGPQAELTFIRAMREAHARDGDKGNWLRGLGAGLSALSGSFSRIVDSEFMVSGKMKRMNDAVFKYNGMNWWSRVVQGAFVDLGTKHLGKMATLDTLPATFVRWLGHYGITESDFKAMSAHAVEIEGMDGVRLSPDMIPDKVLSRKLGVALDDSMRYAMLEPSVSDEALLRFGTQAGTLEGEAFRTALQYKSFPLTLYRKMNGLFAHAYGDEGLYARSPGMNSGRMHKMAYFGSMLFLGWVALSAKDILRGREPMHMMDGDQWTAGNFARLMSQASTLGLFEDLFSPEEGRQVKAIVGPAGGMAWKLAAAPLAEGRRVHSTANAVIGSVPGASIPFANSAMKSLFSLVLGKSYETWEEAGLKRHHTMTGQSDLRLDSLPMTQ